MTLELFRSDQNDSNSLYEWILLSKPEALTFLRTKLGTNPEQHEAFDKYTQKDVLINKGRISLVQVSSARPSYINALIIQSRGIEVPEGCTNSMQGVFVQTIRLPGYFGGCCGNCKWKDHGTRCSVRSPGEAKHVILAELDFPRIEEVEDEE